MYLPELVLLSRLKATLSKLKATLSRLKAMFSRLQLTAVLLATAVVE